MPPKRSKTGKAQKGPIDQRLVKALTHDLRVRILGVLNERVASPNELSKEIGEPLGNVSYHVKVLLNYGCIELVSTAPRRGAVEHYYRATSRAFLTDRTWFALPDSVRPGLSADLVESIANDAAASLEAGTFDERTDRHLSRTPVILDDAGWKELTKALEGTMKQVEKIQKQSSARLKKSGDAGFTATVGLLGFEIPDQRKEGSGKLTKPPKGKK